MTYLDRAIASRDDLSVEEWLMLFDDIVKEGLSARGQTDPPTTDHLHLFRAMIDVASVAMRSIHHRAELMDGAE